MKLHAPTHIPAVALSVTMPVAMPVAILPSVTNNEPAVHTTPRGTEDYFS